MLKFCFALPRLVNSISPNRSDDACMKLKITANFATLQIHFMGHWPVWRNTFPFYVGLWIKEDKPIRNVETCRPTHVRLTFAFLVQITDKRLLTFCYSSSVLQNETAQNILCDRFCACRTHGQVEGM